MLTYPNLSKGNIKIGRIWNFSLPPVITCQSSTYCASKCYARKAYRQYGAVRNCWDRNFDMIQNKLGREVLLEKLSKLMGEKYFRIHVSGDFFNQPYVDFWKEVAKKFRGTKFLAFTKAFSFDYSDRSDNLIIRASIFEGMSVEEIPPQFILLPRFYSGRCAGERFEMATHCVGSCLNCHKCWDSTEDVRTELH